MHRGGTDIHIIRIAHAILRGRHHGIAVLHRHLRRLLRTVVEEGRRIELDSRIRQRLGTDGDNHRHRIHAGVTLVAHHPEIHRVFLGILTRWDLGGVVLVVETVLHLGTHCTAWHNQFLLSHVIDKARLRLRQRDASHSGNDTELGRTSDGIVATILITNDDGARSHSRIVLILHGIFRRGDHVVAILHRHGGLFLRTVIHEVGRFQDDCRLTDHLRTDRDGQ